MKIKQGFFLLFFQLITVSFLAQETAKNNAISLLTKANEFTVGNKIILDFKAANNTSFSLYCSNSYGSSVVEPTILNGKISFEIPSFLSNKKGVIYWKTISKPTHLTGSFNMLSRQQPTKMESYLGPPSIDAGGTDFTMLVVIPTDYLDNPIVDKSPVTVKNQFLKSEKTQVIYTDKLISYKNFYSPLKSGRMIISSESFGLDSKESDVNIMPAIATNFKIFVSRNHDYADGNQITTFYTSVIKDKNNNIISDGSFIEFFITNKKNDILKTTGITLNGIASAKIIHPDFEDNWKIKAYSIGISESDVLEIKFKQIIKTYQVIFSDKNRTIKVGPLKSFMNQIIPDGLSIKLSIYKNDKLMQEMFKESRVGFAEFILDPNIFENNTYTFVLETAGIEKEFKNYKIW